MTPQIIWSLLGAFCGSGLTIGAGVLVLRNRFRPVSSVNAETERANNAEKDVIAANARAVKAEEDMRSADKQIVDLKLEYSTLKERVQSESARANLAELNVAGLAATLNMTKESRSAAEKKLTAETERANEAEVAARTAEQSSEHHENASRFHKGKHAHFKSLSDDSLAENEILRDYIVDLDRRLNAAETRESRREGFSLLSALAKIVTQGGEVPRIPKF